MNTSVYKDVSESLGLSPDVVEKVYKAYWSYIKETIEALPLKDELTEEEFSKLKTNFNVPSIGKLCCTKQKYQGTRKRFKLIEKLRNAENK
jgi:hypothetical protein